MKLTIQDLLTATKPSQIFSSEVQRPEQYKKLMKMFHPDLCKKVDENTAHEICVNVTKLYKQQFKQTIEIDGELFNFDHLINLDIGTILEDQVLVTFYVNNEKIFKNYRKTFSYASSAERDKISPAIPLPKPGKGKNMLEIIKPDGFYNLFLVNEYFKGKIPPESTAWIISRLLYFGCYMHHNGIINGALSMKNIYINPKEHTIWIPNWFLSRNVGDSLLAINSDVYHNISADIKKLKIADESIDLESIKLIGRMLGQVGECEKFLKLPVSKYENAVHLLDRWYVVMKQTFGKIKFSKFPNFKL